MDLKQIVDLLLHLDKSLNNVAHSWGEWLYAVLFLIVFCETGLVVTPFLPGDSLLFAVGALAAQPDSPLKIGMILILLLAAAIGGDAVNYYIGYRAGPKVFRSEKSRLFNKKHLRRTHEFYEKYGGKTIILARFIPIIRTFAPFVAGIGQMEYWRFALYNVTGGITWVVAFLLGGYYFGETEVVKNNFSMVIVAIVVISIMPAIVEFVLAHGEPGFERRSRWNPRSDSIGPSGKQKSPRVASRGLFCFPSRD